MTNYERIINSGIRGIAEMRVHFEPEYAYFYNSTQNSYGDDDEERERAIQDEIKWLNQESE